MNNKSKNIYWNIADTLQYYNSTIGNIILQTGQTTIVKAQCDRRASYDVIKHHIVKVRNICNLVETVYIFMIFVVAAVQISVECETHKS